MSRECFRWEARRSCCSLRCSSRSRSAWSPRRGSGGREQRSSSRCSCSSRGRAPRPGGRSRQTAAGRRSTRARPSRRSSGSASCSQRSAVVPPRAWAQAFSRSSRELSSRGRSWPSPCRRSIPKETGSPACGSPWSTGTRSRCSRTSRSRSGSGSAPRPVTGCSYASEAGLLVFVATLSLLLTLSRVGVATAAVVVFFWLALSAGRRVEGALLLLASAVPAALVGGWAFTRPALVEDVAERADRVADGAVLGFLALVGAAVVVALVALGSRARARRRPEEEGRPRAARRRGSLRRGAARRLRRRGRQRDLVGRLLRGDRERPEPPRVARPEQPLVLVERGGGRLCGERAGGRGLGHVRDRAQALPLRCAERCPAPQRAAATARGRRCRRARALHRARARRGARRPSPRCDGSRAGSGRPRWRWSLRRSRISCTPSWITTGTSSP